MAPRGETDPDYYREQGFLSNSMNTIKNSRLAKFALVAGVAVVGTVVGMKSCGENSEVSHLGPVDGATPGEVSDQFTGPFKDAADSDISCRTFPGLRLNMTSFNVDGKTQEVVAPDKRDTLRKDKKYTDAIANPLKGETDATAKQDLYESFCENPYLTTVTANFLADLELPNGEKVADSVDWLKDYKDIKDVNDIAEDRFLTKDNAKNNPKEIFEGMQANEELAANLIAVFEQLEYKGLTVSRTKVNVHAPFPAANGGLPEAAVNPDQMRANGIGFDFLYKQDDGKAEEVLCLMFNKGDKRPEIVDCRNPKKKKDTPETGTPDKDTPETGTPDPVCVKPNPECTPGTPNTGKDDTKSPVSSDPNHEDERVRPNRPAPDKAIQKEDAPEKDPYVPPATVTDPRPADQQVADDSNATGSENGNENGTNGEVTGP